MLSQLVFLYVLEIKQCLQGCSLWQIAPHLLGSFAKLSSKLSLKCGVLVQIFVIFLHLWGFSGSATGFGSDLIRRREDTAEAVKRRSLHTHYIIIIKNRFTVHQGTAAGFYKLCECVSALQQKKEDSWKRGVFAAFIKPHHQHVPSKTTAFHTYLLLWKDFV